MFGKLLKYDMKAIGRFWWILAVSVLGLSVAGSFALRLLLSNFNNEVFVLFNILAVLFLVICIFGMIASVSVIQIFVYIRFYKHFFSDEGYLTFTLPVSRMKLLTSKTVNALIWSLLQGALLTVCVLIFCIISPPAEGGFLINPVVFETIGALFAQVWESIGAWVIVYFLEGMVLVVGLQLFTISLTHFCITVGAVIAKKHKVLTAIGIYYLASMVLSFVSQIFFSLAVGGLGIGFSDFMGSMSIGEICLTVSVILLIVIAAVGAMVSVIFGTTLSQLERKLNLA
ncbi:MAG: hypothetical protein IJY47_00725 [Clostridia bacterium]|nr:hypothetical protein [Clostridia bacterium]